MKERIAIIDLGTNTFHLLIAERQNKNTNILHREKQPVKIGKGGINQRVITEEAIQRALSCLKNFKKTMTDLSVERVEAIGTSALRSAVNGTEVVQTIFKETGIGIRLISGDEEAEYIYYGVRSALDLGGKNSLILDIGGGSVEFIIGNQEKVFWKKSFDIGAQRLLELYHKHDPILVDEIALLEHHFAKTLTSLPEMMQKFAPEVLVGSSGTFDTLSEIYCIRHAVDMTRTTGETPLTIPEFFKIHEELISKTRAERMQIPGMIEMRVDMIVVASCLVNYLLNKYSFRKIRVSSYSLKEGVLASLSSP